MITTFKKKMTFLVALVLVLPTLVKAQEFKAGKFPDRIILTWSTDPKTTQAVTWRTDSTINKSFAQILVENSFDVTDLLSAQGIILYSSPSLSRGIYETR